MSRQSTTATTKKPQPRERGKQRREREERERERGGDREGNRERERELGRTTSRCRWRATKTPEPRERERRDREKRERERERETERERARARQNNEQVSTACHEDARASREREREERETNRKSQVDALVAETLRVALKQSSGAASIFARFFYARRTNREMGETMSNKAKRKRQPARSLVVSDLFTSTLVFRRWEVEVEPGYPPPSWVGISAETERNSKQKEYIQRKERYRE